MHLKVFLGRIKVNQGDTEVFKGRFIGTQAI